MEGTEKLILQFITIENAQSAKELFRCSLISMYSVLSVVFNNLFLIYFGIYVLVLDLIKSNCTRPPHPK
jgi:predicted transporter